MDIFKTHFESYSLFMIIGGLALILMCVIFMLQEKEKASLALLIAASLVFFCFAATLDPFLNLWDERFHALVAKNFLNHPFVPTLYDNPVVNMEYDRWDRYHLWFHKQPLFLWQIALSFKLFGVSDFTLRIPNIVMGVFLTYAAFRSGKLLVNHRVGILAGILICTSNYLLELVSGRKGLDHNDFSFVFYISMSLWAFLEYTKSKDKRWVLAIGIFSGFAILCKWVVGLLVYFGWFVLKALSKQFSPKYYKEFLTALLITIILAAPWQIYEFVKYPVEALKEFQFYGDHFTIPLEGHSGTWMYHFKFIPEIYSLLGALFLVPALVFLKTKLESPRVYWALIANIAVVYVFFTIAQTKMPSFTVILFMPIAIALAAFYTHLLAKLFPSKKILNGLVLICSIGLIIYFNLNLTKIETDRTRKEGVSTYNEMLIHNKEIFQKLDLPENCVILNVKGRHYIESMFYTGYPSYNFIPSQEQYDDLKQKDIPIALFRPSDKELPEYIRGDKSIILIEETLQGYK